MGIFDILSLLCGIAMFLFGMQVLGDALKKCAGSGLKVTLNKLTSNKYKGILLGMMVTAVIQSSSATTVMVVGFVNSGTMTLTQAVGVIMGANIGTAVTAWITGLSGIGVGGTVTSALQWLMPSAWVPLVAVIGIVLIMFIKRGRKHDMGFIFIGFAVLMVGMDLMSDAVGGLKDSPGFQSILTMFENPILGLFAGLILTAVVQSSSASIGIMQSLSTTGVITYGTAIPMIMGQNIGASLTIILASLNANKNGKRASFVYLFFNMIGAAVWMTLFYVANAIFKFAFVNEVIGMWGIAVIHTAFKILTVLILIPFTKWLEKLVKLVVPDSSDAEDNNVNLLDDRLLATPAVAVQSADEVSYKMADTSFKAMRLAIKMLTEYDVKSADKVRAYESKVDLYEDTVGTYLVKLSSQNVSERDSHEITKILHILGDLERISDHAVNIVESAEEMRDKKVPFSDDARHELSVLTSAIEEIMGLTREAFVNRNLQAAALVEPLEQVVDHLKDQIKLNHILRLKNSECTMEHGFILSDLLTNFERVSDHCSNIAGCVIEISRYDELAVHKYLGDIKHGGEEFDRNYKLYMRKYAL